MLIKTAELKELNDFKNIDDKILERKMIAIEKAIRSYTHNNFQIREIRFDGNSLENIILNKHPFIKEDDTIQITQSVNDGLYVVKKVNDASIEVDKNLYAVDKNICTLICYPEDVIEGAIKVLKWDIEKSDKVGIASETLSRHSVSYVNMDDSNTINGYPVSLFGFLKPYMKARF